MHSTKDNLQVLHEDNHLVIVNKRAGDIVQGDKTGDKPLSDVVKEYIKEKYDKPGAVYLGTVHRLDRPTSGVVIYARTSKALERLNKMLRDKTIKKTYWAVVKEQPEKTADTLISFLKKNPKNNKSTAYKKEVDGSKKAILHYKTLKNLDNYSLLEIDLETGRHHQIRVQLSNIGCIIKGDLKYGAKRSNKDGGIHLHARKIEFIHPVSKELIKVTAPTPKDPIWGAC
ncbi:RluA family pseudouridine synthase [Tenacibaculum finnmarkense genomovar finnmarkense]|uniref:RluA family pseudouridine synthase n=1 Tax=Tenacibaculum finnmarkense TaxID=2781243 RepID=UPI001E3F1C05|nr:RluA family pseudouridine synthase [Tenacibaculum finnmarkense]MCD8416609.1 RluA family pseudouridine synthase [Tenacibaculum finnmarkense genomovar finnmarkense]MCG8185188.1 RluA family pseudouridine synthase [Tenacibaculum finnmarkense genomovar finnmarkense]MCG8201543.1 RluA family pseudouridine synthase [Tenacibaculum finnmarkense genomovar finnmarkense]MCG8209308.1 RluA family pseudouridine synthase [Tenacibaculum finnmarkense genomovar finnmarkense]MCG8212104.1 RluA family pseudouridi